MSLLQEVRESAIPKNDNMPCGICPEGIADKAFPPDFPALRRCFYAAALRRQDKGEEYVRHLHGGEKRRRH